MSHPARAEGLVNMIMVCHLVYSRSIFLYTTIILTSELNACLEEIMLKIFLYIIFSYFDYIFSVPTNV